MSRFLQLHLLTVYPPANLNRDDTGRPKTAQFGGHTRLRVSSQSLKRAWRTSENFKKALDGHLGQRTQRFGQMLEQHLLERGVEPAKAREIARKVGDVFGKMKNPNDKDPTYLEQLAFIGPEEWATALKLAEDAAGGAELPDEVPADTVLRSTDSAVDIAMFGRMLADDPDFNREAAVQVAHAITTHRVAVEDDYYTAVDDLKRPSEDAGAGFIGEAGFGSGVFYLYLNVDRALLTRNLGGDAGLAGDGIAALVEAAATVAPTGKQKSYASVARASFILAEKGDAAPRTLAAAFLNPIDPEKGEKLDLLTGSITALERARKQFALAYDERLQHRRMSLPEGDGSLAEIIAFAREP